MVTDILSNIFTKVVHVIITRAEEIQAGYFSFTAGFRV